MHLADAFIQSDLYCIQVTVSTFYQLLLSLGIEPMILALLTPCSTSWATGKLWCSICTVAFTWEVLTLGLCACSECIVLLVCEISSFLPPCQLCVPQNRTSYSGYRRPANPQWPSNSSAQGFLLSLAVTGFIHLFISHLLKHFVYAFA